MVDPMSVTLLDENMFRLNRLSTAALLIVMRIIVGGQMLTCDPSEYKIGDHRCCPRCPPGNCVYRHCTIFATTSCRPCPDGSFMDQLTGRGECFSCSSCDEGSGLRINRICSKTADALCEPKEGFYCTEPTEDGCRIATRHKSCGPGECVSQKGSSHSDTKCSPCPAGTFSDGTSASCQPHTQCESLNLRLLKPGTESEDAQCEEQPFKTIYIVPIVIAVVFLIATPALIFLEKTKKFSIIGCLTGKKKPPSPNPENNGLEERGAL